MDKNWNKKYWICLIALLVVACTVFLLMGLSEKKANASFRIASVQPQSRAYLTEQEITPCFEKRLNEETFQWLSDTLCSVNYKLTYLHEIDAEKQEFYAVSQYDNMYLHIENKQILLRTFMQAWVEDGRLFYNSSYQSNYPESDGKLIPGVYQITSLQNDNIQEEFIVTQPVTLEEALSQQPLFSPDYSVVQLSILEDNVNLEYVDGILGYYNWKTGAISFDGNIDYLPSYAYYRYQDAFDGQRLVVHGGNTIAVMIGDRNKNTVRHHEDYTATFVLNEDIPLSELVNEAVRGMKE